MQWEDDGIVLGRRAHGEGSVVLELLTQAHGRHLGLVRGGRRQGALLQPGNRVRARWRARLAEHLGNYGIEPVSQHAARLMEDAGALTALRAVTCILMESLPERDPHPELFEGLGVLLGRMGESELWPALYVRFEVGLLEALGFGLALDRCAVTGASEDLAYVSPKSGRAVSRGGAGAYENRLLRLPEFLRGAQNRPAPGDIADGLKLTAHFLDERVFAPHHKRLPAARIALAERFVLDGSPS